MLSDEIIDEIDLTLDKLIENANAVSEIVLENDEKEAFRKIQESLLAHLVSMDNLITNKKNNLNLKKGFQKNINMRLSQFHKLNGNFIKNYPKAKKAIKIRKSRRTSQREIKC